MTLSSFCKLICLRDEAPNAGLTSSVDQPSAVDKVLGWFAH